MLWGRGKWLLFHVNWKVRPTFDGNRRTKIIMGNREHKITNFRGGWGQGNTLLYFGEHGDIYPHHFGRASRMYRLLNTLKHNEYTLSKISNWSLYIFTLVLKVRFG